ncbi:hypothetical protein PoB_000079000 [Plakobranchus ocellatus]|uniref:Uncharacterized protein n=1 Tax=Plakobranchus ocellatus TaxID=259542 RepID=A0AAV3XTR8_9GAST|nr:hypothetical protein PoB_000079000 [Plakobranchus ocellatus]
MAVPQALFTSARADGLRYRVPEAEWFALECQRLSMAVSHAFCTSARADSLHYRVPEAEYGCVTCIVHLCQGRQFALQSATG